MFHDSQLQNHDSPQTKPTDIVIHLVYSRRFINSPNVEIEGAFNFYDQRLIGAIF